MKLRSQPPVPRFTLTTRAGKTRKGWDKSIDRLSSLAVNAGTGQNFSSLIDEVRALIAVGDVDGFAERLNDRRFVRAAATVWVEDSELARDSLSIQFVEVISQVGVSRLSTLLFAQLFLEHFDGLNSWESGLQDQLRALVRRAVAAHPGRSHVDALESLRRQDNYLFMPDGAVHLAADLVAGGEDLNGWLRSTGLSAYSATRFARVARDEFYLAQIAAADAEQGDHAFLTVITDEVMARQRTESTEHDGLYFGHRVLMALTDKATRRPSGEWLKSLLAIGDDPRFQQTERWRTWWSKVPPGNLSRAVRWMSGLNLTAFLDGIEKYASDTRDESMQRMLKRRKRLLNGLYQQDRIEDVRLVLGSDVERYIRRSAEVDLRDVARLEGGGLDRTAVIYVNCGDFCFVEGSHNFSLHVYVGGPLEKLEARSRTRFHASYLRDELPGAHQARNGESSYLAITHHASGSWIKAALDFLRAGSIELDEHGLMSHNDFAELAMRRARYWR